MLLCHTAVGRYAIEIAVGEQSLSQQREGNESDAVFMAIVKDAFLLRSAIEHIQATLVDKQRDITFTQVPVGKFQCLQRPTADAQIESLALSHDVHHSLKGLFERSIRVVTVAVE